MTALRLILADALATVMLVLWLASVVLIFSALGRLADDPGHVEPDNYWTERTRNE